MSAFGPAVFISRLDGSELSEAEQQQLVEIVGAACKTLEITTDDGDIAEPSHYDYGGYEDKAVGVLLYSSYAYSAMPDEVREDTDAAWTELGAKIGKEVDKAHPNTYRYESYAVED
jgi:hypothetical protein